MGDQHQDDYLGEFYNLNEDLEPTEDLEFPLFEHKNAPAAAAQGEVKSLKSYHVKDDSTELYADHQSDYSISVQRLLWIDGVEKAQVWETDEKTKQQVKKQILRDSTLVVLKIQMHAIDPDQKFQWMSATLALEDGNRRGKNHPQVQAWAPWRRLDRSNETTGHHEATNRVEAGAKVGYQGPEISIGGSREGKISWEQAYFDEAHSTEVSTDGKPNGITWFAKTNRLLGQGVTPEVWVSALFSRTSSAPYLVNFHIYAHAGKRSELSHNTKRFFGLGPGRTKTFSITPGKQQIVTREGVYIMEGIDIGDFGKLRDKELSTSLNVTWGPGSSKTEPRVEEDPEGQDDSPAVAEVLERATITNVVLAQDASPLPANEVAKLPSRSSGQPPEPPAKLPKKATTTASAPQLPPDASSSIPKVIAPKLQPAPHPSGSARPGFPGEFNFYTKQLRLELTEVLEAAAGEGQAGEKDKAIDAVKEMLQNNKGGSTIDSCVRWSILLGLVDSAMDEPEEGADNLNLELVKMLVNSEPFLAFENPHNTLEGISRQSGGGNIWQKGCRYPKGHWKQKNKSTPFHRAAANGNAKALKVMIDSLKAYCNEEKEKQDKNPFLSVLRQFDSSDFKTALQLAAKAEQGKLETLQVLLSDPQVAALPDNTFKEALDSGAADIVEMFLQSPTLVEQFVTPENIIHAMSKVSRQQGEDTYTKITPGDPRLKIIHLLIRHAKAETVFTREVVEKIIALNLTRVWKDERPKQVQLRQYFPLHFAVMHQNLEFVKMFVEEYKETVTQTAAMRDTDGKAGYPLYFNNWKWDKSKAKWVEHTGSPEIRTTLVIATIRETDKMQDLSEILQLSGARELCFDISQFNSKSYRVYDFVHSLIAHRENEMLLKYEPTIKYARFPPMDLHPKDREVFGEPVRRDHREVFDVLKWLRTFKKVKSIIELKVPDRLVNPHNEERIAEVVKDFGVEVLDWRFLDLSLSVFHAAKVTPQIRGLHLYASGKRAVISHWFSNAGLESLTNLAFLRIHVVQETMTKAACDRTVRLIRKELLDLKRKLKPSRDFKLDFEVNSRAWNQKHDGLADLGDLAEKAFPTLSKFIREYQKLADMVPRPPGFKPTKVAIIDNGIMSMSPATHDDAKAMESDSENGNNNEERPPIGDSSQGSLSDQERRDKARGQRTLWSRIKLGRSFVDDDHQLSPWLFASDPHGTQMANLICAIDPACELYVAKVTDGRDGITPHRVARAMFRQAINWAIGERVDIISMSFAMLEKAELLTTAVAEAHRKGIVMLCSTHDEGSNVDQAYPASLVETLTVAACNEYGTLYRPIKTDGFQYMVQGLNVPAGVIPFLDSADRISGSSVATAIAAGLSSLILSCLRLANPHQDFEGRYRAEKVEDKLKEMRQSSESKYIILDKFGGIDSRIKTGEPTTAEGVLKKFELERNN
ncbi:peptidase S8/S53, subtilisin/kexin/sedolisin [Cercophora samala]|uniref:Peptidase S8/S53, subtilisin/kexin/sedolisin n=1 Tax=Cercophora samala TaxID=330535 RepID=A0AA40CX96_9PEZI|nr:peptidase S8/S53, subtilisin/kexin/sedolisin [Cercophora samala]